MRSTSIWQRLALPFVFLAVAFLFLPHATVAQPTAWDRGIRGVMLVGEFRTQQQLNGMFPNDQRNTLITELVGRTKDTVGHYQSLNDANLAGAGALLVYLRGTSSRTDQQIKTMSADDMRNTVIVEAGAQTRNCGGNLQALSNIDVMKLVLEPPTKCLG